MDVLNKLRSTVSSTVSQLSGVLPGNPVTREFEATKHIASCGPGLIWKIYAGYKKSTKQEAAIFVFEKKLLEKYSKRDRDVIVENLRKGVSQLTRLRHPKILTVQHPLEESRESLAFATEPVFASLANALGHSENMPVPPPPDLKDYQLYEVEIKYGLLQLSESLAFLHNDVKLLHRNICPESILISKSGAWKIAGFEFSVSNSSPADKSPYWEFREWEPDLHPHAQPHLDYLAPEYALTLSSDTSSDMFSLGVLIYSVFNKGNPLFKNGGDLSSFKRNSCELKTLSSSTLESIPTDLREYVKMLLNVSPELRPDAHQFTKINFFEDFGAKTLQYLDSLFQWDNLQKSQFYKGLPQVITKMPKRVNLYRILPCLLKEFPVTEMIPFVLPNVLLIAEDATKAEFCQLVLPALKPVFKLTEPIQILLIFLQKMELLLKKTPPEDICNHVLPMVYSSLESNVQQIQELCLSIIPGFASLIDYPSMKNALLPRIKKLCITTPYLSVRVNCLVCIGKLLEHLDKWLVIDVILPMLPEIPSKEPAVLMGVLGILRLTMTHKKLGITKEILATKVIPFVVPMCIENGLTLNQFNAAVTLVKDMLAQVESEHRAKLEQLNSIQEQQKSALEMSKVQLPKKDELIGGLESKPLTEMDRMFEGLGLGTYLQAKDITQVGDGVSSSAVNSGKPEAEVSSSMVRSQSLTMEEKQKLAQTQDMQRRLQTQQSLQPSAKSSHTPPQQVAPSATIQNKPSSAPKDLTNTLINANLLNMTSTVKQPNYMMNNPASFSTMGISSPPYQSPTQPSYQSPLQTYQSPAQTSYQSPSQAFGSFVASPVASSMGAAVNRPSVPATGNWGMSQVGRFPVAQQVRPDLSAFDSLLPSQSGSASSKLTLNQMSLSKPLIQRNGNASSNGGNVTSPLSKSEITDLLG